jgi:hypothetical protein
MLSQHQVTPVATNCHLMIKLNNITTSDKLSFQPQDT